MKSSSSGRKRAGRPPKSPISTCIEDGDWRLKWDIPTDFAGLDGQVEWIRLIRSDRQLRILDHSFTMPEAVVYEYVTATLVVQDHELVVTHHDHEIARHRFPLT